MQMRNPTAEPIDDASVARGTIPRGAVVGLAANALFAQGGRLDGIGVYTRRLELALRDLDIDVRRVASPWVATRREPGQAPPLRYPVPLSLAVAADRLLGVSPGSSTLRASIDVYHATDVIAPPLRDTPVVVTVHDTIPLDHPEWASARLRKLKNWVLQAAVPRADRVIAVSHAAVPDIVERYRVPPERIRVASPGVGAEWFETIDAERQRATLARLGLRPGFFLFVGTLQPRKNVAALLRAYDALPASVRREHQLAIVGREGWGVEALAAELRRRTPGGECVWIDYVRHADLRDVYAGAVAFAFPSLAEGFGLPVLEAFAVGLPVVAYELPSLQEIAGTLATFVPVGDERALSDRMAAAAVTAPSTADAAARRARARQFLWRETAQRTAAVYAELL